MATYTLSVNGRNFLIASADPANTRVTSRLTARGAPPKTAHVLVLDPLTSLYQYRSPGLAKYSAPSLCSLVHCDSVVFGWIVEKSTKSLSWTFATWMAAVITSSTAASSKRQRQIISPLSTASWIELTTIMLSDSAARANAVSCVRFQTLIGVCDGPYLARFLQRGCKFVSGVF